MIAAFRKAPAWIGVPTLGLAVVLAAATLTTAVTAAAESVAKAAGATQPAAQAEAQSASPEELALYHKLDQRMKEISMDGQPLDKVLTFIADAANINMVVNWGALNGAGIDRSAPVSVKLADVRTRQVLESVLQSVGGEHVLLSFAVEDNVLTISTFEELTSSRHAISRVYDVRDVLRVPADHLEQYIEANGQQAVRTVPDAGTPQDEGNLNELIETSVTPDMWRDKGGTSATLRIYKGVMVINAPPMVHDKVMKLLEQLRSAVRKGK